MKRATSFLAALFVYIDQKSDRSELHHLFGRHKRGGPGPRLQVNEGLCPGHLHHSASLVILSFTSFAEIGVSRMGEVIASAKPINMK